MRWAKARGIYKTTWHIAEQTYDSRGPLWVAGCDRGIPLGANPEFMPEDRRPALGRNNVCARCRARFLKTRPDLQGYLDRLNDTRDI